MQLIKPHSDDQQQAHDISILLAGAIDNGNAFMWQPIVEDALSDIQVTVYNPRNDAWDSALKPVLENPVFKTQVSWEIDNLERSDIIFMMFPKGSISPISLLELGYFVGRRTMVVCCEPDYWRKGNVDYMCQINDVPVYTDIESAINALMIMIQRK